MNHLTLRDGWLVQSSALVKEDGQAVSTARFTPDKWHPTSVPSTVLSALVRNGVYPDPRVGLNNFLIPDASDAFNKTHDLAKYSHLPDKRNPWKDPYWYRKEFSIPKSQQGKQVWLNFDAISYRADVWLNGNKVADHQAMVGALRRFRLNITDHARTGKNCLAVKIHQADHVGTPTAQLDVFGKVRNFHTELMKDVSLCMSVGYDCMPTVRDRNMGLWQGVYIDFTGPVDIRAPFVKTDLPLPKLSPASLTVSAELVNTAQSPVKGVLRGIVEEAGVTFEREVALAPGETRTVEFSPQQPPCPVIADPRLWWPRNYGEQNLYSLSLSFRVGRKLSDVEKVTFGVREITSELHELDGEHGRRILVNGKKVFCRGGYIQPEILFDWDAERMDAEIRYLTQANLNLVYFEDIANPPDEFLDACDRHGLMFGNCFYGCYWMTPGSDHPKDVALLETCTVDILKRIRNHPSLILYMAMNEGDTREDVYEMWRKHVIGLDGTRLFIPSGSFPGYRKNVPEWIKKDTPVGMNDYPPKTYGWQAPSTYYQWVRTKRNWMFMIESGSASLPPMSSLSRFIPHLGERSKEGPFPLSKTWAHHGANSYYKPYDGAVRRIHGAPESAADYCWKGHLVTADQHRAMFEAANHRMWDITSGFTQWKVSACWPSVQWQIYDWYLKPMVSYYYIRKACEPLHVQLCPLDSAVAVINNHLEPQEKLRVSARVYNSDMKLKWRKTATATLRANSCKDVFAIPQLQELTPVYFVKLEVNGQDGELLSDNFYWLSSKGRADLKALRELPPVKLEVSSTVRKSGEKSTIRVKVTNPTDKLAFFTQLAVTRGARGEEVLPVLWEDNYFSLLPRESKEIAASFATSALAGAAPTVEVGGWNIEGGCECTDLRASAVAPRSGRKFKITATIKNTFLDGSRAYLYVDDRPVDSQFVWARGQRSRDVVFSVTIDKPGRHRIRVGGRTISILVDSGGGPSE